MNRCKWLVLAICTSFSLIASGCGSSEKSYDLEYPESYAAQTEEAVMTNGKATAAFDMANEASYDSEAGGMTQISQNPNAKLIRDVNLDLDTKEFDAVLSKIQAEIKTIGGYVEDLSVSGQAGQGLRYANMTARIPSDKLDAFLTDVEKSAIITYRSESVRDVTLEYVDMESRKASLLTERDRLMQLMETAETVSDIIELEDRLSQVRYEIESMESQLRTIDHQVSYSTVMISVNEVEVLSPAAKQSTWERICSEFSYNLSAALDEAKELIIWVIVNLPFIVFWALVILVVILIISAIRKITGKSKSKFAERARLRREKRARKKLEKAETYLNKGTASKDENSEEIKKDE